MRRMVVVRVASCNHCSGLEDRGCALPALNQAVMLAFEIVECEPLRAKKFHLPAG